MMNTRRGIAVVASLLAGLALGCTEKPVSPTLDNPFDQQNPDTGGDPFQLQAIYAGNQVSVTWQAPAHPDIADYVVRHSADGTRFTSLDTVVATSYVHRPPTLETDPPGPAFGQPNYYKVLARNSEGALTIESLMTAAQTATGPRFRIAGGAARTSSRLVDLSLESTAGDTLEIADNADFEGSYLQPATFGDTVITVADWDLGPAEADETEFALWARIRAGGVRSPATRSAIRTRFQPRFQLAEEPGAPVATRLVDLEITGTVDVAEPLAGITEMRFALSAAALATAPWLPFAPVLEDFELDAYAGSQTVHGEFAGDLGYNHTRTLTVVPDGLAEASFAAPDVSDLSHVLIVSDARATLMRFSESPSFVGAPWTAYADTSYFALSPDPGLKVIYGQFRNDWYDSPLLSDAVTYTEQPVEIAITSPVDGGQVPGGAVQIVRGFAGLAGGALADSIAVLAGNQTFELVPVAPEWEVSWAVPDTVGDVSWVLGARAYAAGGDSALTSVTVTVTQLAVRIRVPAPGSLLEGGTDATVSGVASASLFGAALDSVTVALDGTAVAASGLETWNAVIPLPDVLVETDLDLSATVHAGGETAVHSIPVTIQPAPGR